MRILLHLPVGAMLTIATGITEHDLDNSTQNNMARNAQLQASPADSALKPHASRIRDVAPLL
jgi:hypothetical protein